jgi:chromosomal replication initiator protein
VAPEEKKPERSRSGAYATVEPGVRAGNTNLNPAHVFNSYVVGSSNRFSHAAALSVADKPGQAYNPLFLYGEVGLGKTHLLHAIGNAILQKAPNTVIRYMSCEKFTNEVINSIREQKMVEFRKRYREIGVLLMDDIQFIEGKESTQEEFFHTFNHLRDNGKQIVLTSDRPPKALAKLAERLRSRFEWGLIADIQPPDYEMRLAILSQKAEQLSPAVPNDVLDYIASTFTSNIRELEGALTRAHAYCQLMGAGMTVSAVSQVLQIGNQKRERTPLTIDRIIDAVASYYQVEPADIRSSKRSQDLTVPRHIAMYIAKEKMDLSFPRVGQAFGGRKHTSVKYAYDKLKEELPQDPNLEQAIRQILRQLDA